MKDNPFLTDPFPVYDRMNYIADDDGFLFCVPERYVWEEFWSRNDLVPVVEHINYRIFKKKEK